MGVGDERSRRGEDNEEWLSDVILLGWWWVGGVADAGEALWPERWMGRKRSWASFCIGVTS